ncbi:MAG: hypothetical protein HUU21_03370 [Polyangiaceae bacterium]|nr:hypothetical protein [Polyangiaceae bacterium]
MIEELEAAISHFEGEGARRFARWDAPLYRAFIEGPGASLLRAIRDSEGAALVFEAYLRLLVEAVGHQYIDAACLDKTEARSPKSLMALALTTQIPTLLPKAPPGDRMALLATTWNLAEGLLGEPAWLNRAVAGALANADSLADLDKRVLRVLEAALLPRARASLAGPFSVRSVDTRAMDHAFLPGLMHFSAPALLCVHDRKRKGIHAGLLLGPKGAASLLGPCPCLGRPDKEPADLPTITLIPGGLRVGDAKIPLTFFQRGHSAAASRAGYLVASALDSQRLWVVESP